MDIAWLEDYLALRDAGSFTAAAERRNTSQPAFSRRIQALEAWLGVTLVDRSSRPPCFTPLALENDAEIRDLLNHLHDLRSRLRGEQTRSSRLRLAVQHSLSISLFPRLIERLRGNGFQPVYWLHCGDRADCIEMLFRDEVDLLICYETPRLPAAIAPSFATRSHGGRDAMVLVGLPALERYADGFLPDGPRLPLLAYPQSSFFGQIIWEQMMPLLSARYDVETICISGFSSALREMVLAGMGVAWLPRSLMEDDIASGAVTVFDPDLLQCRLDVAIYMRPSRLADEHAAAWRNLLRSDDLFS